MPVLFPGPTDALHVRIFAAGEFELGRWWVETDHRRGFWRLSVCDRPGAWLKLENGERFDLDAGRVALVPPQVEFECRLDQPVRNMHVFFEIVGWPAEAVKEVFASPLLLESTPSRDRIADELRDLISGSTSMDAALACRAQALVHLSIAEAIKSIPEDDRHGRLLQIPVSERELLAVLRYIDANLEQPCSNAELAKIAGASESRFIRHFRRATGQTPGRYTQERRVSHAAELLVSTDYSINEIAERCGFANRYYFSRVFAQRMGYPPARYRRDRHLMDA